MAGMDYSSSQNQAMLVTMNQEKCDVCAYLQGKCVGEPKVQQIETVLHLMNVLTV